MNTACLPETESLSAEALIDKALEENRGRACITCSFQTEDMVVLHLLRRRLPEIPVLFLETGYHFAETYAYRDRMTAAWNLNLVNLSASTTVAQHEEKLGVLYQIDPTRCCQMRKVEPLMAGLENFETWFTGLRREQSPTRKNLKKMEDHQLPTGKVLAKVSPLADWTWAQVLKYAADHEIEVLPLYEKGYLSIGCEPCTSLPTGAGDPRSGRWAGRKLECGIHTFTKRSE